MCRNVGVDIDINVDEDLDTDVDIDMDGDNRYGYMRVCIYIQLHFTIQGDKALGKTFVLMCFCVCVDIDTLGSVH